MSSLEFVTWRDQQTTSVIKHHPGAVFFKQLLTRSYASHDTRVCECVSMSVSACVIYILVMSHADGQHGLREGELQDQLLLGVPRLPSVIPDQHCRYIEDGQIANQKRSHRVTEESPANQIYRGTESQTESSEEVQGHTEKQCNILTGSKNLLSIIYTLIGRTYRNN